MGNAPIQGKTRKGIPNKAKAEFRDALRAYAKKNHVEPHYWMVDLLANNEEVVEKVLDENGMVHEMRLPKVSLELKFKAASELAQYLEPKLRSMVVEGNPDNPLTVLQALPDVDLDALITRRLREAGYDTMQQLTQHMVLDNPYDATGYDGGHNALPETEGAD